MLFASLNLIDLGRSGNEWQELHHRMIYLTQHVSALFDTGFSIFLTRAPRWTRPSSMITGGL